jgi:E3 ubiquitin-protein ligase TRIP12
VREYVALVQGRWLGHGVRRQVAAFRAGIADVFPLEGVLLFDEHELQAALCGRPMQWTAEALSKCLHPSGGFTRNSAPFKLLAQELLSATAKQRRQFLLFVTSVPSLSPSPIEVVPFKATAKPSSPSSRARARGGDAANADAEGAGAGEGAAAAVAAPSASDARRLAREQKAARSNTPLLPRASTCDKKL